eukprot:151678-Rhodomonas_salina.1
MHVLKIHPPPTGVALRHPHTGEAMSIVKYDISRIKIRMDVYFTTFDPEQTGMKKATPQSVRELSVYAESTNG